MIDAVALLCFRSSPLRHLALWYSKAEAETMRTVRSLSVTSLSERFSRSIVLQYASAIAAVLIALLASRALHPYVGDRVAFVLLLPAVAFSAWF